MQDAVEAADVDVELIESHGTWTLRFARSLSALTTGTMLAIRVRPNLVPGGTFSAEVVIADADAPSPAH